MSSSGDCDGEGDGEDDGERPGQRGRGWQRRRRRRLRNLRRQVFSSEDGAMEVTPDAPPDAGSIDNDSDGGSSVGAAGRRATSATAVMTPAAARIGGLWHRALLTAEACGDRLGRFLASIGAVGGGGGGGSGGSGVGGVGSGVGRRPLSTEQRRIREEEALERRQRRSATATAAAVFAFTSAFASADAPDAVVTVSLGGGVDDAKFSADQRSSPLPSVSSRVPMVTVAAPIRMGLK